MEDEDINIMNYLENNYWFWKAKKNLFKRMISRYCKTPERSLDIGCGAGAMLAVLKAASKDYMGIDTSKEAIEICKKKGFVNVKVADAEALPFNEEFDLITASDMLEHCDDYKAMRSVQRALKDGGILILTVPMFAHLWGQDDTRLLHKRRYTKKMLKELCKDLDILKMSYTQMMLYPPALLARMIERKAKKEKSFETFFKERVFLTTQRTELGQIAMLLSLPFKAFFFLVNFCLKIEQYVENFFAEHLYLPFGVGMVVVCRKRTEK